MTKSLARAALLGALASIPASKSKAISESHLQRAAEALWPPSEEEKQLVGADPTGHLENMPPAVLADRIARRLGYGPLDRRRSSAYRTPSTTASGPLRQRVRRTRGSLSSATAGAGTAAGRACTWRATDRRCRCCESRRLRGVCPGRGRMGVHESPPVRRGAGIEPSRCPPSLAVRSWAAIPVTDAKTRRSRVLLARRGRDR